ncbi:MAG TPA: hypothetical protein VGQ83_10490 [Polyangia bacterium]
MRALLIGRRALVALGIPVLTADYDFLEVATGASVAVPRIVDLIALKRLAGRPKDLEDIQLLRVLQAEEAP